MKALRPNGPGELEAPSLEPAVADGTMRRMAHPVPIIILCRCKGLVEDRARNGSPRLATFAAYRACSWASVVLEADEGAALPQQHGERAR